MTRNLVVLVLVLVSGLGLGWLLFRPAPLKPEPPAPAVRQKDGSLILERKPEAIADVKPQQIIPRGAKVERIVQVTVKPKATPVVADPAKDGGSSPSRDLGELVVPNRSSSLSGAPGACPPVTVDLSLVRMPDKTRRVIASSPDGEVIGGVDVPILEQAAARERRWTIQALRGYERERSRAVWGGSVSYSRSVFSVSGGAVGSTTFVGAGIRF